MRRGECHHLEPDWSNDCFTPSSHITTPDLVHPIDKYGKIVLEQDRGTIQGLGGV